jgi:hypothetical protein
VARPGFRTIPQRIASHEGETVPQYVRRKIMKKSMFALVVLLLLAIPTLPAVADGGFD